MSRAVWCRGRDRPKADHAGRRARWAVSEQGQRLALCVAPERDLGARRMFATRSAAPATRAIAGSETSHAEAFCQGCRPSRVRLDAAGDVAEPLLRARVALGAVASSALGQSR